MIVAWIIAAIVSAIVSGCVQPCYTMVGVVQPSGDIVLFDACRGAMKTIPAPLPPPKDFNDDDDSPPPPKKQPA